MLTSHLCVTLTSLSTLFLLGAVSAGSATSEEIESVSFTISGLESDLDTHSRAKRGFKDKLNKWWNRKRNKKNRKGKHVKELDMNIKTLDGKTMNMRMGKMKSLAPVTKTFKMEGGKMVEDTTTTGELEFSLFMDVTNDTDSVFLMACDEEQCQTSAAIYAGTDIYTVEPASATPFLDRGKSVAESGKKAMNDERVIGIASDGTSLGVPFTVRKRRDLVLDRKMTESLLKRKRRQLNSVENVVELFIIIDNSEYQYWYERSGNDAYAAKMSIELYIIMMINMMDMRFEDLYEQTGDLSIKFMISGMLIAESESDSPWLQANDVESNGVTLTNANKLLDDLTVWGWGIRADLPSHDHVLTVTKSNIASKVDGEWITDIIGIAWTGAMCVPGYSISIVEDPGIGLIDFAGAHEIGHSLNAKHDGAAGCSDADYFVMGEYGGSPAEGLSTTGREDHSFRFSTCSVNAIRDYVASLGSANCMQSSSFDREVFDKYKSFSAPGVFLPIDTQCELQYGSGSRRCYALEPSVCSDGAWCWNPADPSWCYTMYVREGSLCGDKMRCHKGACVNSTVVMPTCPPSTDEPATGGKVVVVPVGVTAIPDEVFTTVTPYMSTSQTILASQQSTLAPEDQLYC